MFKQSKQTKRSKLFLNKKAVARLAINHRQMKQVEGGLADSYSSVGGGTGHGGSICTTIPTTCYTDMPGNDPKARS